MGDARSVRDLTRWIPVLTGVIFGLGMVVTVLGGVKLLGLLPKSPLPPPYPRWVVSHIGGSLAFIVIAAAQTWPRIRRSNPRLHRRLGWVGAAAAAVMALSGVAMAYLPERPFSERLFMTLFFLAFSAAFARAIVCARARNYADHRAWMARAIATALTPVVQRVLFPVFAVMIGIDGPSRFWEIFVSSAWMAWLINMILVEAWLASGRARSGVVAS